MPLENGNAILQYLMIESINRTPPLMFPAYDEEKGWSLNGVMIIKNFQGKNRTIEAIASIGGEKDYNFLLMILGFLVITFHYRLLLSKIHMTIYF